MLLFPFLTTEQVPGFAEKTYALLRGEGRDHFPLQFDIFKATYSLVIYTYAYETRMLRTCTEPQRSEPCRLISRVQRGTQPGLKQKSQAIYQAADADSLNSLAQKLLQTRPLLKQKDKHNWIYDWNFGSSHFSPLLSLLISRPFFLVYFKTWQQIQSDGY